jgi:hypothetical protein
VRYDLTHTAMSLFLRSKFMKFFQLGAFGAAIFMSAGTATAKDCELKDMVGVYDCKGSAGQCRPAPQDEATLYENSPNDFRWRDGVGNVAIVTIDGNNLT